MRLLLALCFITCNCSLIISQVEPSTELHKVIKTADSLLFDVGFNQCDISQFEKLIDENCEFYHDKSGFVDSKEDFVASIRDGLCKMEYKAIRKLDEGSMEVYPLNNNGVLYGAVQTGVHRFFAIEGDKPEYFTSIAQFTHLWIVTDGEWQLKRIISYDHLTSDR